MLKADANVIASAYLFPSSLNPEVLEGLLGSGQSVNKKKNWYQYSAFC